MANVFQRLWNMLAAGSVTAADDSGPVMRLQVKVGYMEVHTLPAPQQFGFSSVPPIGSDAAAHYIGGDRSNGFITATNHQPTRPTGKQAGEAMVFNAFGMQIYLSENGITINGGGKPIVITNSPTLTQNGDFHATGAIIAGFGTVGQVGMTTHTHTQPQDSHGDSEQPTNAPTAGT